MPGASLSVSPVELATLGTGATRTPTLPVNVPGTVAAGEYLVALEARLAGQTAATLGTSFSVVAGDGPAVTALLGAAYVSVTPE